MTEDLKDPEPGQPILAPIAAGELLDKIAILEIKAQRITDAVRQAHVLGELNLLKALRAVHRLDIGYEALAHALAEVNLALWEVEEDLRGCEQRQTFDSLFVDRARAVYRLNDRRAALKRQINLQSHSIIVEEKSYLVREGE